jgi:hypothetical protein
LIASTPGEEGKGFESAKTLKQHDLTLTFARRSPGEGYELTGADVAAASNCRVPVGREA